jgi:hypothetical protein
MIKSKLLHILPRSVLLSGVHGRSSACINHGRYPRLIHFGSLAWLRCDVTGRGIVWQVRAEPGAGLRGGVRGQGRRGGGELNLRQLCVHRVANESGHPWTWWDYKLRCSMKEKYSNPRAGTRGRSHRTRSGCLWTRCWSACVIPRPTPRQTPYCPRIGAGRPEDQVCSFTTIRILELMKIQVRIWHASWRTSQCFSDRYRVVPSSLRRVTVPVDGHAMRRTSNVWCNDLRSYFKCNDVLVLRGLIYNYLYNLVN